MKRRCAGLKQRFVIVYHGTGVEHKPLCWYISNGPLLVFSRIMCFAVFTASSACSLHCGYSTKYNLWLIPHALRKFWKSDDLHCWSLSLAVSSGAPYDLNSDCKRVSNEAVVVLRCSGYHYCTTSFNKA